MGFCRLVVNDFRYKIILFSTWKLGKTSAPVFDIPYFCSHGAKNNTHHTFVFCVLSTRTSKVDVKRWDDVLKQHRECCGVVEGPKNDQLAW